MEGTVSVIFKFFYSFKLNRCFIFTIPNPSVKAGLQGTGSLFANQTHNNSLKQRAFSRPIIPGKNRPPRIASIRPRQVKIQFFKPPDVFQDNSFDIHDYPLCMLN